MSTEPQGRAPEHWSRNLFFVLACIGAAVGLGSIWRFPYMAFRNGGGAFLFPYLISFLIVGLPVCLLELALGKWGGGSIVAACQKTRKSFSWIGWWMLINSVLIVFYYCVVLAWCVQYFIYSFQAVWGADTGTFFMKSALNLSSGPQELGGINWPTLCALTAVWLVILVIVRGGLKGISRTLLITVPVPYLLLLVMAIKGLTLPGGAQGVMFLLKPRFSELWQPSVWSAAITQTTLALSLAMGQMVAYASRQKDEKALPSASLWVCGSVVAISLLAGIVTFSMMGFLAQQKGVSIPDLKLESITLAFVSYPMAVNFLPFAALWGAVFFAILILISVDSAFSVIEATLSGTAEMLTKTTRKKIATTLCIIGYIGGIIFATRGGMYWLDIVDHWVEKFAMPILVVLECIVFAWFAPIESIGQRIKSFWKPFPVPVWKYLIRFVAPALLIAVFLLRIRDEGLTKYQNYPESVLWGGGWAVFAAVILISAAIAVYYNRRAAARAESTTPS